MTMDSATGQIRRILAVLFGELVEGASPDAAFVLNPSDPGLLRALENLPAAEASRIPAGRTSSVAAHVDHLRYGLELMNRWNRGEDPFAEADYSASWARVTVTDEEWAALRTEFRIQAEAWALALQDTRPLDDITLTGIVASVVHLAYHLGAIRQIAPQLAGPRAKD
jgi:hypothetical protein